jgi:addiction module RelE/StbE family toxin
VAPRKRQILWSDLALTDLQHIQRWVSHDRPAAARKLATSIQKSVERLASFPESGQLVPGFEDRGCREIVVRPHRVVYVVSGTEIHVLRVWHARRGDPR